MKEFCCGDVVPGCTATFRGLNEEDILTAVGTHARLAHGITEIPVELLAQVRSLIHTAQPM